MKQYLTISLCRIYKPDGWTEAQYADFTDKMIELAESYGPDIQMSATYQLQSEEELDN